MLYAFVHLVPFLYFQIIFVNTVLFYKNSLIKIGSTTFYKNEKVNVIVSIFNAENHKLIELPQNNLAKKANLYVK